MSDLPRSAAGDFIASDSDNVSFMQNQALDNLMHVVIALGAEAWTTRRRMKVLEKLLEKSGVSSRDIEAYRPDEEETKLWQKERDVFIKRTFSALERRGGANGRQPDFTRE
jgi:hypothetical protein